MTFPRVSLQCFPPVHPHYFTLGFPVKAHTDLIYNFQEQSESYKPIRSRILERALWKDEVRRRTRKPSKAENHTEPLSVESLLFLPLVNAV